MDENRCNCSAMKAISPSFENLKCYPCWQRDQQTKGLKELKKQREIEHEAMKRYWEEEDGSWILDRSESQQPVEEGVDGYIT